MFETGIEETVVQLAAGSFHSAALTSQGQVGRQICEQMYSQIDKWINRFIDRHQIDGQKNRSIDRQIDR